VGGVLGVGVLADGRDLPAAATALRRGEIDVGFGRVYPAGEQGRDRIASRLARLAPVDAVLSTEHPLAGPRSGRTPAA
jgi:hypothetical protein